MLRPNGSVLILYVASHPAFEILKNMTQDIRFASYTPVNIILMYYFLFKEYLKKFTILKNIILFQFS